MRHLQDTGKKRYETVKSEYDSQTSGLEEGPSDVVSEEEDSHSSAVKTPAIIEEDNGSVSERLPNFVIEFAEILLLLAKQRNGLNAWQLVDLLAFIFFEINFLRRHVKSLADSKDLITKHRRELMKDDGFL